MATSDKQVSTELSRELSLFHVTMMGLGMMIGAGVFVGLGTSMAHVGPGGVVLTFALNGVLAIFTAMSYAELSSAIPRAGGAYNFARIGFGRGTSFVAGWMEWFASSVAGSLYAVTFAIYTLHCLEELEWIALPEPYMQWLQKLVAVVVAAFFLYINYRGASATGKVGAFFTLGQTLLLAFIGVIGIVVAVKDPERLQNFKPFMPNGWSKLLVTMGFTYVAFEGFEVIAQAGDEAVEPRRNIPKAMIYSVFIATLTYVAVSFAAVVAVKAGMVEAEPWRWIGGYGPKGFGKAIGHLLPSRGLANFLVTLAVIFASTSALNATIYSATRASYALGRDRMLPAFFARISRKRKTPWVALVFTGGILIAVASALPTEHVAASASIMFLFLFLLVNLCVIRIRRNMGDELQYGFIMPLFPLFPLLAILAQTFLAGHLVQISWVAWVVAPLWVGAGILIYHLYSKSRTVTLEHDIRVFEEQEAREGDEYRIMVPVANPKNAIELVRNTYKLCGAKQARVELLHMVPVPDQVPLSDAGKYMLEGKEGIVEAMIYLAPLFPISTHVRYCRNVGRGIVSAVRQKKVNMLIMGWHGRGTTRLFSFGSTVDPVIERAPCDVVVMKDCGNRKFKRVLVPVAGGPNAAFALEVASILVEKDEGEIVALTVSAGETRFDVDAFVNAHQDRLRVPRDRVRTKAIEARDVTAAILKESEDYDLIVLGCTRRPWIYQFTRMAVPEMVAQASTKPIVMVKAAGRIRSWFGRWI